MSRNRLPAIVEVLTGISIVASLILLTMKVRANTKALDRQIRLDRAQAITWTRLLAWTWMELEADFRSMGRDPVLRATVVGRLSLPYNLLYWESARDGFTADFVSFVEDMRGFLTRVAEPDDPGGG